MKITMTDYLIITTLIFTTLKLAGKIDWGWQWVLAPIILQVFTIMIAALIILMFIEKEK